MGLTGFASAGGSDVSRFGEVSTLNVEVSFKNEWCILRKCLEALFKWNLKL